MQILNYWTQFEHTGKVEDYLSYVSAAGLESMTGSSGRKDTDEGKRQAGANPYAGIHMCNRNDIEADPGGRV